MNKDEEEKYSHPSFGQIRFSRINSNGTTFYGSELRQDNYIQLTISPSEIQRDLAHDRYFARNPDHIVLRLSANQFSELLTSLNQGDGVPCTIERLGGKYIEHVTHSESRKEFVHRKFENRMKQFAQTLKEKQEFVKVLSAKKTLTKQDQFDLNHTVQWLTQEVAGNIPFFAQCFQETMDEVVLEAKSEIENAIQHKITTLGLEALHEQNKLLK